MLLSKSIIVGYERHSETERKSVDNDGLTNLNLLKIQSGPLGNPWEQPFDGDKFVLSPTGSVKSV